MPTDMIMELSARSCRIMDFVAASGPSGAKARDVAAEFGKDTYQYLKRRVEEGRLIKLRRGVYAVPPTSRTLGGCSAGC